VGWNRCNWMSLSFNLAANFHRLFWHNYVLQYSCLSLHLLLFNYIKCPIPYLLLKSINLSNTLTYPSCNVLLFAIPGRILQGDREQTIMESFSRPVISIGGIRSWQWHQFCYFFTKCNCCHTLFSPSWEVNLDILYAILY